MFDELIPIKANNRHENGKTMSDPLKIGPANYFIIRDEIYEPEQTKQKKANKTELHGNFEILNNIGKTNIPSTDDKEETSVQRHFFESPSIYNGQSEKELRPFDSSAPGMEGHIPSNTETPSSQEMTAELTEKPKNGLPFNFAGWVYRRRKERYIEALQTTQVGRALLEDPVVRNVRLTNNVEDNAVYQAGPGFDPYRGAINLRDASSFPSRAEHDVTFVHEALHHKHNLDDRDAFKKRLHQNGTHDGWSNAEEEFTITGRLGPYPNAPSTVLHENAARQELNLQLRHAHASLEENPPREMTAAEYQKYRNPDNPGGAAVAMTFGFEDTPAKLRPLPPRLRRPK